MTREEDGMASFESSLGTLSEELDNIEAVLRGLSDAGWGAPPPSWFRPTTPPTCSGSKRPGAPRTTTTGCP